MNAAMDVGVVLAVIACEAVNDRLRLVSSRRVIQVDQRIAAHRPAQDREILTDRGHIERRDSPLGRE